MRAETTRAVTYERNSSAKQKSIDDQRTENLAAAAENGWTVAAELSDPTSASRYATKARQNWATLLGLLPTVDVVILWEPSRGDRSLATWAAFLDACRLHAVRIHAVTHQRTYDPRLARDYRSLAEDGVDAAYESDKTSARVRRAKATSAAAGRPNGVVTYGYTRIYDSTTTPPTYVRQDPHPQKAAVVERVFSQVADGTPLYLVTKRLMRDGIPAPQGGAVWRHATIRTLLSNETYRPHVDDPERGRRTHDGVAYVATWPPLVDEATWQAAHRHLGTDSDAKRRARLGAPGRLKWMLSSSVQLMTAPCGSELYGRCDRVGRGAEYGCRNCHCVAAPMPLVDEYVSRLVVARLSRRDARRFWAGDDTASRRATGELARLRAELQAARVSFYAPGGISAEDWMAKQRAMAPAIADAEERARPTGAPVAALKLIEAAKISKATVRPTWDAFPVQAQREVIAGMFSSLVLGPMVTRINRWTDADEKQIITADRITHEWRKP